MHDILVAFALVLVIEGIWPFLNPTSFRRALAMISSEGDRPLRIAGFFCMLFGLGLLHWVRG